MQYERPGDNVVSLEQHRQAKLSEKEKKEFKKYLELLSVDELQIEVNHFLESLEKKQLLGKELVKAEMILEELANRTSNVFSRSIHILKRSVQSSINKLKQ